eukprot:1608503-Amphidinium_carterae.1
MYSLDVSFFSWPSFGTCSEERPSNQKVQQARTTCCISLLLGYAIAAEGRNCQQYGGATAVARPTPSFLVSSGKIRAPLETMLDILVLMLEDAAVTQLNHEPLNLAKAQIPIR